MKVNKWTLGLAAIGLVSLPSLMQADEKMVPLTTALSSTVISGYINTSIQWNPGTGNNNQPGFAFNGANKADGFNLNAVKIALERPLDEGTWAAGYKAEIALGPDANALALGNGSSRAIKQAYVALRAPLGTGLDFKVGVFDTIIGYETFDAGSNPNFTRSYGYTIEPTTHTGVLATYQFNDIVGVSAGVANSFGPNIGGTGTSVTSTDRAFPRRAESYKTYMGSFALKAPSQLGFLEGSTLYAGVINGYNGAGAVRADQTSWYVGSTLATPIKNLKLGASYDYAGVSAQPHLGVTSGYANATALYLSYQITEKLSVHNRGEYFSQTPAAAGPGLPRKVIAVTSTVQYDLWKNVLSRLEFRWDRAVDGTTPYGGTTPGAGGPVTGPTKRNNFLVVANLIYKF